MAEEQIALIQINKAKQALAEAKTIPEIKLIRNQAEAIRQVARQAGASLEVQNDAAEIRIRAERRAGEMLAEMDKQHGARPPDMGLHDVTPLQLSDLGISKIQSHRWQLEASLPDDLLEKYFNIARTKAKEFATLHILRLAKDRCRQTNLEENQKLVEQLLDFPSGQFKAILLDPPWDWGDEGDINQFGRAKPTYATIPFPQLLELPVDELADRNSHIYLWITNRSLPKGFDLLKAWGFRYITLLTWCKPSFGMGNYFRGQTEHIIFGVRGSCPLLRHNVGTWFQANRGNGHSSKPEEIYQIIESCSPKPWLEMFARQKREGWHTWGAEIAA